MYFENMHARTKLACAENNFLFAISAEPHQTLEWLNIPVEAVKSQTLSQEYEKAARRRENCKQIRAWGQSRDAIKETGFEQFEPQRQTRCEKLKDSRQRQQLAQIFLEKMAEIGLFFFFFA